MCLNLLIDLIPNNNGIIAAWKWAKNKIEKNKINSLTRLILNLKQALSYLSREKYHCPKTIINIVSTKGKAGYLVWKLAGGQGDQDINLPCGSLLLILLFDFCDTEFFVANPLSMVEIKYSLH